MHPWLTLAKVSYPDKYIGAPVNEAVPLLLTMQRTRLTPTRVTCVVCGNSSDGTLLAGATESLQPKGISGSLDVLLG